MTSPQPTPAPRAICVDLDGTLVATDILIESILLMARQKPWLLLWLPLWMLRGKAYLKRRVAEAVTISVSTLPYRQEVLALLATASSAGRPVVLATAADQSAARAVADHLGLFSEVFASDGRENLSGPTKAARLAARFGPQKFDYVGNDWVDVPVWRMSFEAVLVGAPRRLAHHVRRWARAHHVVAPRTFSFKPAWQVIRTYQWVKNLLIFVPAVAAHEHLTPALVAKAVAAFFAFSFCASGIYILNDLLDIDADRLHPRKRTRPFAAGTLSIPAGLFLMVALLTCSFALALSTLPVAFSAMLLGYVVTTTAYSCWLKRVPVADVFVLASLYALRVFAGGTALAIPISTWLVAFALFFFLSLAFVKRYAEVSLLTGDGRASTVRGYVAGDAAWLQHIGLTSGYLAVLVLALYVTSVDVMALYTRPRALAFLCPLALYWITRTWFRAQRGGVHDDPIIDALRDPLSYAIGAVAAGILVIAAW